MLIRLKRVKKGAKQFNGFCKPILIRKNARNVNKLRTVLVLFIVN